MGTILEPLNTVSRTLPGNTVTENVQPCWEHIFACCTIWRPSGISIWWCL